MTEPRAIWIAGAGLSGAVIARALADAGHPVTLCEARDHVAGNCHTERDAETGVLVHRYGPHIFHTGDEEVWAYVSRFAEMRAYRHRVWTQVGGAVYPMPITLATINQFFGTALSPDAARAFIAERTVPHPHPQTFVDQALSMIGPELYGAFFEGYTRKQWGCDPADLPAAILKRLPLRFSYDDSYFNHPHQAIPKGGYTAMVQAILDHPGITVHLNRALDRAEVPSDAHLFWSGPIDAFFGHDRGRLGYRTLDFEIFRATGDYQGCPVMNYGDADVPFTRITEHKHFAPWETHDATICARETSRACGADDIPYYPIRLVEEKALLRDYVERAEATQGVTFVGRLGTYRYLDMDVCIREALNAARGFLARESAGSAQPAFFVAPL